MYRHFTQKINIFGGIGKWRKPPTNCRGYSHCVCETSQVTLVMSGGLDPWTPSYAPGFGTRRNVVWKSVASVIDEAEVSSWLSGVEWGVVYFAKLPFQSNKQEFSLRGVESLKICSHYICLYLFSTVISSTAFLLYINTGVVLLCC